MKLKNRIRLITMEVISLLITVGATIGASVLITLMVMGMVVTVATVFELKPPYKPILGFGSVSCLVSNAYH